MHLLSKTHKVVRFPAPFQRPASQLAATMKLATILSFVAAAAALPAATSNIAARASYSKVDGLKFNIDGVTKCTFSSANSPTPTDSSQTTPAPTATGYPS